MKAVVPPVWQNNTKCLFQIASCICSVKEFCGRRCGKTAGTAGKKRLILPQAAVNVIWFRGTGLVSRNRSGRKIFQQRRQTGTMITAKRRFGLKLWSKDFIKNKAFVQSAEAALKDGKFDYLELLPCPTRLKKRRLRSRQRSEAFWRLSMRRTPCRNWIFPIRRSLKATGRGSCRRSSLPICWGRR